MQFYQLHTIFRFFVLIERHRHLLLYQQEQPQERNAQVNSKRKMKIRFIYVKYYKLFIDFWTFSAPSFFLLLLMMSLNFWTNRPSSPAVTHEFLRFHLLNKKKRNNITPPRLDCIFLKEYNFCSTQPNFQIGVRTYVKFIGAFSKSCLQHFNSCRYLVNFNNVNK